jgi:FHS family L-fucose permease-like MFS transporter
LLLLAVTFFFLHLPRAGTGRIEREVGALKYPHVVLGAVAIFLYVGGEVSVGSTIINFLGEPGVAGLPEHLQVSFIVPLIAYAYVAFYGWKGCRIGRGLRTA